MEAGECVSAQFFEDAHQGYLAFAIMVFFFADWAVPVTCFFILYGMVVISMQRENETLSLNQTGKLHFIGTFFKAVPTMRHPVNITNIWGYSIYTYIYIYNLNKAFRFSVNGPSWLLSR